MMVQERAPAFSMRGHPHDFVFAPHGGMDFGIITPETAGRIGMEPGVIRLQQGFHRSSPGDPYGTGFGATHIWASHRSELEALGYKSPGQFVDAVLRRTGEIHRTSPRKDRRTGAITKKLAFVVQGDKAANLVVELRKEGDGFYSVTSAYPMDKADATSRFTGRTLLARIPLRADASGQVAPPHHSRLTTESGSMPESGLGVRSARQNENTPSFVDVNGPVMFSTHQGKPGDDGIRHSIAGQSGDYQRDRIEVDADAAVKSMAGGMKRDIGPLARWFATPDYTFQKHPVAWKIYNIFRDRVRASRESPAKQVQRGDIIKISNVLREYDPVETVKDPEAGREQRVWRVKRADGGQVNYVVSRFTETDNLEHMVSIYVSRDGHERPLSQKKSPETLRGHFSGDPAGAPGATFDRPSLQGQGDINITPPDSPGKPGDDGIRHSIAGQSGDYQRDRIEVDTDAAVKSMAGGMKRDIGPLARWFATPDYTFQKHPVARRPQKDKIKKSPGLARGNTNFLHPQSVP